MKNSFWLILLLMSSSVQAQSFRFDTTRNLELVVSLADARHAGFFTWPTTKVDLFPGLGLKYHSRHFTLVSEVSHHTDLDPREPMGSEGETHGYSMQNDAFVGIEKSLIIFKPLIMYANLGTSLQRTKASEYMSGGIVASILDESYIDKGFGPRVSLGLNYKPFKRVAIGLDLSDRFYFVRRTYTEYYYWASYPNFPTETSHIDDNFKTALPSARLTLSVLL